MGSRKIYAVKNTSLNRSTRSSKGVVFIDSNSSGEDIVPMSKKRRFTKQPHDMDDLIVEVRELRENIAKLFEVNKQLPIPIGLRKALNDTFKCIICQSTISPPVIFGRCCKCLIGCQTCVDRWYRGEQGHMQTCPRCRAERGYAETCIFKGLDDFLTIIHPLTSYPGDTTPNIEEDEEL